MSTITGTTNITIGLVYKSMRLGEFDVSVPVTGDLEADSLLLSNTTAVVKVNAVEPTIDMMNNALQAGIEAFIPAFETEITKEPNNGEIDKPQA